MTLLQLKQQAAHLKESERRELSEFLLKLGRTKPAWRKEMARRLDAMDAGDKVKLSELKKSA